MSLQPDLAKKADKCCTAPESHQPAWACGEQGKVWEKISIIEIRSAGKTRLHG